MSEENDLWELVRKRIYNDEPEENEQLPEGRIKKMLLNWVDLHKHSISEKTKIILEHFHLLMAPS